MALRNNAYNRFQPDAYGNSTNRMLPTGALKPTSDLKMRGKNSDLSPLGGEKPFKLGGDYNKTLLDADKEVANLEKQKLKAPEFEGTDFNYSTAAQGVIGAASTNLSISKGGNNFSSYKASGGDLTRKGWKAANKPSTSLGTSASTGPKVSGIGAAGIGAGTAVVGAIGAHQAANKNEDVGGALSGAAAGAGMGMALGPVGAAIGAGIGGVAGYIFGKKAKNRRREAEEKERKAREKHNAELAEQQRIVSGRGGELAKYQRVVEAGSRYDKSGNLRYKKGGLLKYEVVDAKEVARLKSIFEEPTTNKPRRITEKFEKGGELLPSKTPDKNKLVFKFDKDIPKFRRGGELDLKKQNVIVDGPSHDEENNTGVKGDRGLPIVKRGAKVAEIESEELVINKKSAGEIEKLAKLAKTDKKAKEKLGELLHNELTTNTYDYSELMKD